MADRDLLDRGYGDSLEGKGDDLKGKVKDGIGGLTGDTSLQGEGKLDQLKGKAKDMLGGVERSLGRNRDDQV